MTKKEIEKEEIELPATEEQKEIEEIEKNEEEKDVLKSEVLSYPASYSLWEYSNKMNKGIFYKPEFQRNSVWNPRGKSRFIESLLFDYPVPQVFLYKEKDKESYLIVDGFQRISTIHTFLNDGFKLTDVNEKFEGFLFSKLPEDAQEKLRGKQLSATIIRQIDPDDIQTLYHIFERLNTGGQNLNNMEIRRAINYGELIKTLEELNKDDNWRKILGKPNIDNRFTDVELILRLIAFYDNWNKEKAELTGYTKSMKPFLNEYCKKNQHNSKEGFKKVFIRATKKIIEEIGEKPFTIHTRPNYVLLDSIMTAIIINDIEINNLKEKFEELKINEEYKKIYTAKQGTISVKSVNDRLRIAMSILKNG